MQRHTTCAMQSGAIPCNIKDEEAWPTALWTGYDVKYDEEGNTRMNSEAGDLVVKGLEGENADETRSKTIGESSSKPAVGLVEDLRGQLAKVSKERNAIEKERDDNDEMVTALKQELEKVRKEKVLEVKEAEKVSSAVGLRSKCERLVKEKNDLKLRLETLERENVMLLNESVREHFSEFLKKEEGIVDVDQYMMDNYQMKIPEDIKKQIEDERADKKAKEGEYAQLEDLAYKSSNAFHKLTKQTKELKRDKEDVDRKEEGYKTTIADLQEKLSTSQERVRKMEANLKDHTKQSLEQKSDNCQNLNRGVKETEKALEAKEKEICWLQAELEEAQKKRKERESDVKKVTKKLKEVSARGEEEKRELEAKIESSSFEHSAAISECEEKIKRLKEELKGLRVELEKNEENLNRSFSEVMNREEEVNSMKIKLRRLAKELNRNPGDQKKRGSEDAISGTKRTKL